MIIKEGSIISAHLEQFLKATWDSPVFGDTFERATPARLEQAGHQLAAIAKTITPELAGYITTGLPELDPEVVKTIVTQEILPKTLAFCPALTVGEVDDIPRLGAVSTAVALMYWGDQTMDRGDLAMADAIMLLGRPDAAPQPRLTALRHIEDKINQLAAPEDAPLVLACFYDQVLRHEVAMQRLSQEYLAGGSSPDFIATRAAEIAEIGTISAGFPSVASSLYAIYRHHNPALPPLAKIYAAPALTDLIQACNAVVRLWDELGDWSMDAGHDPAKGIFVINPFNQYHPAIIQRYCELAAIQNPAQIAGLQHAVAEFHVNADARIKHTNYILETLRRHIQHYVTSLAAGLSSAEHNQFDHYITLCKRVLEIGYINRIGDIALTAPDKH